MIGPESDRNRRTGVSLRGCRPWALGRAAASSFWKSLQPSKAAAAAHPRGSQQARQGQPCGT